MSDLPPNHSHRFLQELEKARESAGMSPTRFGYIHFGDPAFFKRMREGRRLQKKTIELIHRVTRSV